MIVKSRLNFRVLVCCCSTPQDGESSLHSNRALVEYQAGKNVMTVAASVFRVATDLLQRAQGSAGQYTHCCPLSSVGVYSHISYCSSACLTATTPPLKLLYMYDTPGLSKHVFALNCCT